jgi:hypothetical protein
MDAEVEDFKKWGDAWVYCSQHLAAHKTGWCTVDVKYKTLLCPGDKSSEDAEAICRERGFTLFGDK